MNDRTEQLIREAFEAEADHAPDPRPILAKLARARSPRFRTRHPAVNLMAAAAAVVVVALVAVAIPTFLHRDIPADPAAGDQNVLVMGLDGVKKTEMLMLVHLDEDGTASVASLPDGVPRKDSSTYSLNEVYRTFGPDRLRADIRDLTGVTVDHYVAVNMTALGDIATAAGGVPVCLNAAAKDPDSDVSFPAGTHSISGKQVLAFVRQQDAVRASDDTTPYPYFVERQEAFLTGLASKVGEVDPRKLLDAAGTSLRTDKDLDLLAFAARLEHFKGVRYVDVGADLSTPMYTGKGPQQGHEVLPLVSLREFVTAMFDGASHPGGPRTPELPFTKRTCVF
jgi:LCP family protein required for cell wall assembly